MKLRDVVFYVGNIEKAKDFYQKLGFEVERDFGKFVSFKTEDANTWFSINLADESTKVPGKQTCIFWSENIEEDYKRLKVLGMNIAKELYEAPFGKTFSFRDIDGNKIEIVEKRV
jgi:catechol 2,3-dioxygenase-like lactoylglutathione lyase family enzyme